MNLSARPAIVFIHGALNDHSVWSAQADALSAQVVDWTLTQSPAR